jgi:hypothetical protein
MEAASAQVGAPSHLGAHGARARDAKAKGVKFGRMPKLTGRQKREAIRALKQAGELETRVQHRQVKYLTTGWRRITARSSG